MSDVFGTFLMTTKGGQYNGEFFNNHMKKFSSEEVSCIETSANDPFVGRFDANWQEKAGSVAAVLEIDKEDEDIYILTWKDVRVNGDFQNVNFTGRGVRRNEMLVCVYSMNKSMP